MVSTTLKNNVTAYLVKLVVVPRVSAIVSLHVQHVAFHLFSLQSTSKSLNANLTTSGELIGLLELESITLQTDFEIVL
jgi:hypothetical protein